MYICAHCGSVRDEGEQSPPVLDTGTTFRCAACDGDTVVALMTPEEYEGENAPGSILAPVRELRGYVVELRKMLGDALEQCAGWKQDATTPTSIPESGTRIGPACLGCGSTLHYAYRDRWHCSGCGVKVGT